MCLLIVVVNQQKERIKVYKFLNIFQVPKKLTFRKLENFQKFLI